MSQITKFFFQKAKYLLGDEAGNEVYMVIDYKNAKHRIIKVCETESVKMSKLRKKVDKLAGELVARKHQVNFFGKISE